MVALAWVFWATDAKPAGTARLFVVQAVPQATYDVAVDGEVVERRVKVREMFGPLELAPGDHTLAFIDTRDGGRAMSTSIVVPAGSSTDVVIHRPAALGGAPVVSSFEAPTTPIGPGKARLLVAHTATVPPADVRVDGKVVFANIANGEYAEVDVPAGEHEVAVFATGESTDAILGPLVVDLPARTLTVVYAVGAPRDGSMNVITHRQRLAPGGNTPPDRIGTGEADLVADLRVRGFGRRR
jgi:hypothetical protein